MRCPMCGNFFDADQQMPVCPHELLNRFETSPLLLPEKQRLTMDEAFRSKDADTLRHWRENANPAVRDYAEGLLEKLLQETKA